MQKQDLYQLLDIETIEDFKYFENAAELFENDMEVDDELMFQLLNEMDLDTFKELVEEYFDYIEEWIPEAEIEIFTLVNNIRREILSLIKPILSEDEDYDFNKEEGIYELAEEIIKFRTWFNGLETVECINNIDGSKDMISVRDAFALYKEEKISGSNYNFDFSESLNYDIADYRVSFSDLANMMW